MEPRQDPKRRWFRFSLRTLVIGVLLAGSAFGLWFRWEPWAAILTFEHPTAVSGVGFAPDGSFFYSVGPVDQTLSGENILHVWDSAALCERFSLKTPDSDRRALGRGVAYSSDSRWLCIGRLLAEPEYVVDAKTGAQVPLPLGPNESHFLPPFAFSEDGRRLIYCTHEDVRIRELETGREIVIRPPEGLLRCSCNYSPRADRVAVEYAGHFLPLILSERGFTAVPERVELYDGTTGQRIPVSSSPWEYGFHLLAPAGTLLAVAYVTEPGKALSFRTFDARTGKQLATISEGHPSYDWVMSHDGRLLFGYDEEQKVTCLYEAETGRKLGILPGKRIPCEASLSWNGDLAVMNRAPESSAYPLEKRKWDVYLWDPVRARRAATLEAPAMGWFPPADLVFLDHQRWIVSLFHGLAWDCASGKKKLDLGGLLVPSPDTKAALSWMVLDAPRLVDFGTGEILVVFPRHPGGATCASFSPDGQRALYGTSSGTVQLWEHRRPEWWWGLAWLPEFWLTLVFAGALVWSVWRDRRTL